MTEELKIFLVAFIIGAIWYRIFLKLAPKSYVLNPFARGLLKLQWHHYHHGIIIVTVSAIALTIVGVKPWVIILLGIGLGFIIDEFVWSLMMPGNRTVELEIYQRSFKPTLIFLAATVLLAIFASYLI